MNRNDQYAAFLHEFNENDKKPLHKLWFWPINTCKYEILRLFSTIKQYPKPLSHEQKYAFYTLYWREEAKQFVEAFFTDRDTYLFDDEDFAELVHLYISEWSWAYCNSYLDFVSAKKQFIEQWNHKYAQMIQWALESSSKRFGKSLTILTLNHTDQTITMKNWYGTTTVSKHSMWWNEESNLTP